jgi:hypothetical protein
LLRVRLEQNLHYVGLNNITSFFCRNSRGSCTRNKTNESYKLSSKYTTPLPRHL